MSAFKGQIYQFGEWRLDPAERLLQHNGATVPLTPKVFETLLLLVENGGKLVTKDEFMKRVWPDTFVEDLALVQNISQIRKVMNGHGPVIETVSKRGYRLLIPVSQSADSGPGRAMNQTPAVGREGPEAAEPSPLSAGSKSVEPARGRRILLVAGLAVVILGAVGLLLWGTPSLKKFAGPHSTIAEPVILPIISLPGEQRMPALSPDGDRVVFVWQAPEVAQSGVYVAVVGNQSKIRLTTNAADQWPAWSSDGRYIAFERYAGRKVSIYLEPALGGAERLLHSGEHSPWWGPEGLSFSPDGKWLAFADWTPETQQSFIKLIALDGSESRTLTSPPTGFRDAAPVFSPTGDRIAFVRSTGPIFVDEIFIVPVTGGTPQQITFERRRIYSAPVWTKDGQELLFPSNRAGMESLWRIPVGGGTPAAIPGAGPGADHPSLSFTTGELAYEYIVQDENVWRMEIHNHASSGAPPRALLSQRTHNLMPQLSPDGTKIAFESGRSGYEEIWMSDADGSNPTQVTHLERYSGSPRWSPDGKALAFDFRSDPHTSVYVVELPNGAPHSLVSSPDADNVVPSWSGNGRWIYFASNRGSKDFHLWKVRAEGGMPIQVTRNSGFMAFESRDGRSVYYSRLTQPGIWNVPVDGGAERLACPDPEPDDWANWAVSDDGIYFMNSRPGLAADIKFMEFSSGKISLVGKTEKPSFFGLTLSSDKKALIYSQRDRDEHDIVMTKLP